MHDISEIKVSAPGSIMLMGEHAVLFGHRAIACAVDKRIHLVLTPRADQQVIIQSSLADYQSDLDTLLEDGRLTFVLYAIRQVRVHLRAGFDLSIQAEFSHTVGLGSSAAVTAALVKALSVYCGESLSEDALFSRALAVIHGVQGRGSGTDLAASVWGGLIAYTVEPRQITPLSGLPPISLVYAGYKTKTPDVLAKVAEQSAAFPEIYQAIYRLMHTTACEAEAAITQQDWVSLGRLMNIYQGLMDALGVNDFALSDIIYTMRASSDIYGAKISGSGLGDCVIGLGIDVTLPLNYESIPVSISKAGVVCHVD